MANFPIEIMVKLTYNIGGGDFMAEFCLACWNKMHRKNLCKWDVKLSWGVDFCEGCGEWKRVVLEERRYWDNRFALVWLIIIISDCAIQLLLYPIRYYIRKKRRFK